MQFDAKLLPDEFSRTLFEGSLRVLEDKGNLVRLHLFAAGFRELFGYILHSYAPDEDVRACVWFRQAPDTPSVTRKQRATYATQGGLTNEFIEELGLDIASLHKDALKAIDALNRATHVQPGTIVIEDDKITPFVENAVSALSGLITSFGICRDAVASALRDNVYSELMQSFVERTFDNIDLLAGKGYEVDPFIDEEEILVESIGSQEIIVKFKGVAPVTLHYGKGEDAAEIGHDFPFWMRFSAPVSEPKNLEYVDSYFDDSGWYQ